MRVLLAFSVISLTLATQTAINLPCNRELDGLLAVDPDGNPTAFLSCQGVGVGNIGFWERKMCPNEMIFDFINQRCKATPKKVHRKPQTNLNIAILNSSCAKGETCIGGTVCDRERMRCLCPYGTIPQLETLSCIKNENAFSPDRFKFSFENTNSGTGGFLPNPSSQHVVPSSNNAHSAGSFMPNPNFNKFTPNSNSFASNSNYGNAPWTNGQSASSSSNNFGDMMPNHKFVFGSFGTTQAPTTKSVPRLAEPGQSCRSNEICMGGSLCTFPIGLCLCPGDLEARDGECVLPASSSIKIQKVGIGAVCNDLAECDDGSACQMGRCACVSPLVQFEGKCVLRQERKEVGPGDLCDNGEICGRGSICDIIIPVCVCPSETDLFNGDCVRVHNSKPSGYLPSTPKPIAPQPSYIPQTTQAPLPIQTPSTKTIPPVYTFNQNIVQQPSTYSYQGNTHKVTSKPNHMKIALGGSKQAGVGVRCSLNTDCMIGAYCNGNTSPPSCQCLSTHVNVEGRCEKVIYPGQIGCRSSSQCTAAYAGTICIDRICKCPEGTKTVDQTCIPANEPVTSPPGGSCTDARECTGGSVCREGWCICPDPSMIVQKGICIQSGIRPTLPPKTVPVYTTSPPTAPVYQTQPSSAAPTSRQPPPPVNTFNALPAVVHQGRKVAPGSQCGPLDSCVGGSMCLDGLCVCSAGTEASQNGRCEVITTTIPTTRASSTSAVYSKPGEDCADGQTCTGGSICNAEFDCVCPSDKPVLAHGVCSPKTESSKRQAVPGESCDGNTECINGSSCHSGQCRCAPQFIALSGFCVQMPMSTTPQMKTIAKPLESCENGETCEGGSKCDDDTLMCMCPKGQVAFGPECKVPPGAAVSQVTTQEAVSNPSTTECENDNNCGDGKLCVAGRCRCRPGTVDNAGICELLEALRPKQLKYGQPCDYYKDRCTNAAKCIDSVCKCPPGLYLNTTGWCEYVNYTKLKTTNASSRTIKPFASTSPAVYLTPEGKPTSPPFFASIGKGFGHKTEESEEVLHSRPIYERPYAPDVTTRRPTIPTTSTTSTTPTTTPTTTSTTTSTTTARTTTTSETLSSPKRVLPRMRGRKPGSTCRDSDICMGGSGCTNGRCQCEESYIIKNGRCTKALVDNIAVPGNSCAEGEQCTGGSICDSDTHLCICAARHIILNGVCKSKDGVAYVHPGSSCDSDLICSGGSNCINGICQCDSEHYSEDGYCRHITARSSQIKHDLGGALRFSSKSFAHRNVAGPCDMQKCRLPDCFCSHNGRSSPLPGSPIHDVPQFIVLTFDDAVNGRTLPDYKQLFQNVTFRNPNGCPIKGTFFVSHEWTNYDSVQWLSQKGMELASNSISHVSLAGESASRWLNEMDGQRRIIAKFSNSLEEEIVGMRAPQLAAGGDEHFEMMSRSGFLYDNTLSANPGDSGEPYWPQTLDYQVPWNCHEENCPTSSFPGIWEVPLNQFYGIYLEQIESYRRSSMVRAAVDLNNTVIELTAMLTRNFNRAYKTNRAPFVLSLNADFLQLNGKNTGMKSLNKFLHETMQNKDVFVVTMKQLVEWMKNPLPMTQIHRSETLRCPTPVQFSQTPAGSRLDGCSKPNKCMYRTPTLNSQEHQFLTCSPCPEHYPWLENPIGTISS